MKRLFALAMIVFTLSGSTQAPAADLSGTWALRSDDGTTIYRFEIAKAAAGWTAAWVRPTTMRTDGHSFFGLKDPVARRSALSVVQKGDGLELTFDDPRPGASSDVIDIRPIDSDHVIEDYLGLDAEPVILSRVQMGGAVGPWDVEKVYTAGGVRPTNAEMTAIFTADQDARKNGIGANWTKVREDDGVRRRRTAELLKAGALQSGDDFLHAAFVYQHGDTPDDYMLAHILATVAVARGQSQATWIASATLDRYLMATGHPQILGTQYFKKTDGDEWTQEPYDRNLVSDALRRAMHVPAAAEQEKRLLEMRGQDAAPAKPK